MVDEATETKTNTEVGGLVEPFVMCDLPYKSGTTKERIIFDGWSRGFNPNQTVDELTQMGFEVPLGFVTKEFERHQNEMEAYYMRND